MISKNNLRSGVKISCTISGYEIRDAAIQIERDDLYICQNILNGCECGEKHGYSYSWLIPGYKHFIEGEISEEQFWLSDYISNVKLLQQEWDDAVNYG